MTSAAPLWDYADTALRGPSIDLTGVRFGDLLGEAIVATGQLGKLWRLRCRCGRASFLSTAAVRRRFSVVGDRLACGECMAEEARSKVSLARRDTLHRLWDRFHTLYSSHWVDNEIRALRTFAGFGSDIAPALLEQSDGWDAPSTRAAVAGQRAAYLYPLDRGEEWLFECELCRRHVRRCFGCVLCLGVACIACVRLEQHSCEDKADPELRYAEVARRLNLSRERIRQISWRAYFKARWYWETMIEPRSNGGRAYCSARSAAVVRGRVRAYMSERESTEGRETGQ